MRGGDEEKGRVGDEERTRQIKSVKQNNKNHKLFNR